MRKPVRVLGIIAVCFAVIAAIFKSLNYPGGGLATVLSAGIFVGIVLPIAAFFPVEKTTGLKRGANVAATLAAMHGVIFLLFLAQNWSGKWNIGMQGIIVTIIAIILQIIATRRSEQQFVINKPIWIMTLLVMAGLSVSAFRMMGKNEESHALTLVYKQEKALYDSLEGVEERIYLAMVGDTDASDSEKVLIQNLYTSGKKVIAMLEQAQRTMINEMNNGLYTRETNDTFPNQPMDVDYTTWFFIGGDVQNPTGHAMDLYIGLADYRNNYLHPDVPFFIPFQNTEEDKVQWVKDNFYHAKAIEVMTRLTLLKENVVQSIQYSMEHHLFVK